MMRRVPNYRRLARLRARLVLAVLSGSAVFCLPLVAAQAPGQAPEQAPEQETSAADPRISAHNLRTGNFNLHYRSVGSAEAAVALWIHGTPGSWADIVGLMRDRSFTEQVRLVSIDRPGWGASQFVNAPRLAGTFAEHSKLLRPLLQRLHDEHPSVPLVVAGHSWGAPMVATLGADHPDLVDGIVALAGPFDPAIRILRWYNYAGALPGIRTLIGGTLRNSNEEMFQLRDEVRAAQNAWRDLRVPMAIVQGLDDGLVPIAHLEHAERLFRPELLRVLRVPDQGHLLQFQRTPLIGRCVLALARADLADCRVGAARLH